MPGKLLGMKARSVVLVALLSVLATVVAAPLLSAQTDGGTPTDATVQRFAGESRFETAGLIATDAFGDAGRVVVARGGDWPDALSGNFLAGLFQAPVVLIGRDTVPDAALEAMATLGTTEVVLLGGTAAISESTEMALQQAGFTTERVQGASRFETAVEVARQATSVQRGDTAIVATGENFADALVVGPIAYSEGFPLLLTPQSFLHPATMEYLSDPTITDVIIPGGQAAVSADVQSTLEGMGKTVTRLAGDGRVQTAVRIAEYAVTELDYTVDRVNVATADPFADALALAAAAGVARNPLLIENGAATQLTPELDTFLRDHACTTTEVGIAGGTGAFSEETAAAVLDAVNDCDPSATPTPTPTPTPTDTPTEITAPQLEGIELIATTGSGSTYRYTFDQPVELGDPEVVAVRFRLYAPYITQIIEPMVQPFGAEHRPFINFADSVAGDPDDDAAVIASFDGAFWNGDGDVSGSDLVTVAAVAAGAVANADGDPNPETSSGVQAVALADGATLAPNLLSVTDIDPAADTATFNFDKDVQVFDDTALYLVVQTAGGQQPVSLRSVGAAVGADGRSIVATFDDIDPAADLRRAWVDCAADGLQIFGPFIGTPLCTTQAVDLQGEGETSSADLILLEEDQDAGTIDFSFDNQLDIGSAPDASRFYLYFVDGSITFAESATVLGNQQTVRVQFGDLQVTDGALGAGLYAGAVTAANGFTNTHDELGFARSFPSGGTASGTWTDAALQAGGDGTQLVLTFDRFIPDLNGEERIALYNGQGIPLAGAVSGCVIAPGLVETVVTCEVLDSAASQAAIVGLQLAALSGDVVREFFDTRIGNHEQSRVVNTP